MTVTNTYLHPITSDFNMDLQVKRQEPAVGQRAERLTRFKDGESAAWAQRLGLLEADLPRNVNVKQVDLSRRGSGGVRDCSGNNGNDQRLSVTADKVVPFCASSTGCRRGRTRDRCCIACPPPPPEWILVNNGFKLDSKDSLLYYPR